MANELMTKQYFGMREEDPSNYGVTVEGAITYIPLENENLPLKIEQIGDNVMIGIQDRSPSHAGLHETAGGIKVKGYPINIEDWIKMSLGSGTGGVYGDIEIATENVAQCVPYSLFIQRGFEDDNLFQITGAVANKLELKFGGGAKELEVSADIIAKEQTQIADPVSGVTLGESIPYYWHEAVVTASGTTNIIEDMTFTINNNIEKVVGLTGSNTISTVRRGTGKRSFDLSMTINVSDITYYNLFKNQSQIPLTIVFTKGVATLTIDIPHLKLVDAPYNRTNSGGMSVTLAGRCEYDSSAGYSARITVV